MKIWKIGLSLVLTLGLLGADHSFAVRKGGTFNWIAPYGSKIDTLDPNNSGDEQNGLVTMNIFRCLYRWNAAENKPQLELADAVDISPDGLVYTYSLKRNVKFHNGRQLTADDIIYTYNRIANPDNALSGTQNLVFIRGAMDVFEHKAKEVAGLKKIDDHKLEITLTSAIDPAFFLYSFPMSIVPKEEVERMDRPFSSNPVGCGPFKFVKWVKGSEVVLERFEDYYESGKPYLDKLVFKIMSSSAARDLSYRAKELDANLLYATQYAAYKKDPELSKNLVEVAEMFTRFVAFNPEWELADGRKPFSDVRVRQAFNYAINTDLIVKKYAKNKAYPAISFLAPTTPGYDPNGKRYEYNPEKAKALMKAAGYEKGFDLEIIGTGDSSYGTGVIEVAIPFLKKINISASALTLEGAAKYKRQGDRNFEAMICSFGSGPDGISALMLFHSTKAKKLPNVARYKNGEYDRTLDLAAETRDPEQRIAYVKKANEILQADAPIWFYNYNKAVIAHHPWVHGIQKVGIEHMFQDFTEVWVEATSPRANAK
ncbi:MAG: ABC transporter substrate-binding protein [Desulfobacteraceae bacterium]|nr:ABC transporter substrate-binding protein [Desulfobacteraceae bacterium]